MMSDNYGMGYGCILPLRKMEIPPPTTTAEGDMSDVCPDDQLREILARDSVQSIMLVYVDGSAVEYSKPCTCDDPPSAS